MVGHISGQNVKPKKINDQRDSSDLRSNTPFASSTKINSASGRLSGSVTSACGIIPSDDGFRDCHVAQYPDTANEIPMSAATKSNGTINFSRITVRMVELTSALVGKQSDNSEASPSMLFLGAPRAADVAVSPSLKLTTKRVIPLPQMMCIQ